jgi:hypothetical protein
MNTYRNPWYTPRSYDPEIYRTDAKPKQLGKYLVYYRIQSSKPSARCYDYVLDGVVMTQRCGGNLSENELDVYLAEEAGEKVRAILSSRIENAA